MGCTNSTPREGPAPKPAKVEVKDTKSAQTSKVPQLASIPEAEGEWVVNPSWTEIVQKEWETAVADSKEAEFQNNFQDDIFARVRKWLDKEHPACASAGTIEDMGKFEFPTSTGPCQLPARYFVTLDDDQTGLLHSLTLVIAPPLKEEADRKLWLTAGSALNAPEMIGGQQATFKLLSLMQKGDVNVKHALIHIFMGADMVTCKFDTTTTAPTVTMLSDSPSSEFKESNDELAENALEDGEEAQGIFQPLMLRTVVQRDSLEYPSGTVWDEGEFPLSVEEEPYPHPTRLIAVRDPNRMSEALDSAAFKIFIPGDDFQEELTLMRNLSPHQELGGIVSITLVVGVAPDTLWPKCGAFIDGAVFKAADDAMLKYANKLYGAGQAHCFRVAIAMGADRKVYKIVGNDPGFPPKSKAESEPSSEVAPTEASESQKRQYSSLEAFSVSIEEITAGKHGPLESHLETVKEEALGKCKEEIVEVVGPVGDVIKQRISQLSKAAHPAQILVS